MKAFVLAFVVAGVLAPGAALAQSEQVCPGLDSGKIDTSGTETSITVTAPEGFLISGYCVKAGSGEQAEGPVIVAVDPPQQTVTITHPSGKEISHYSLDYVPVPAPTPTTPAPAQVKGEAVKGEVKGEAKGAPKAEKAEAAPEALAFTGPSRTVIAVLSLAVLGLFLAGTWMIRAARRYTD